MPLFDLPLAQLQTYAPDLAAPADFDAFWTRTLTDQDAHPLAPEFTPHHDEAFQLVTAQDLSFAGYGGTRIHAWWLLPANSSGPLPCIVSFVGYGGGRGLPIEHLAPPVAGFAHLVMDTRGQGSAWSPGDTSDDHADGGNGPQFPGFMTRGIRSPETYYYRRLFTDAARAVRVAASHPRVDPARIAVSGASQGGGIAIAAAALAKDHIKLCLADVPFLCHYRRATEIVDTSPYNEISNYLKNHRGAQDNVFQTLAYFDGTHFAPRVTARSLFSVGLMDTVCPPSTVYAAYNRLAGPREIAIYPYNNHEGGGTVHLTRKLQFARQWL